MTKNSSKILHETVGLLLNADSYPGELLKATKQLHDALHDWAGIEWHEDPTRYTDDWVEDTILANGKAISPYSGAMCILEFHRTTVFVRAIYQAIKDLLADSPNRPLKVLYAGTGPFAPLALCQVPSFSPEQVQFTLLDIHQRSLDTVRKVVSMVGAEFHIERYVQADAITWAPGEGEKFELIISEVMLRALSREPQVAVTKNLAPYLADGGIFIPEVVEVSLSLVNPSHQHRYLLGNGEPSVPDELFRKTLWTKTLMTLTGRTRPNFGGNNRFFLKELTLPEYEKELEFSLFTEIRVYDNHFLGAFDCSLTVPERVANTEELKPNRKFAAYYRFNEDPGIELVECSGK